LEGRSETNAPESFLILVDTSIWIDFFSSSPGPGGDELRRMVEEVEPIALTGVVVTEILQGLRRDIHRMQHFLSLWDMLEPCGFSTYREASTISRLARSKGIGLTTIDTLIAAVALEHHATLFSLDKDFTRIARIIPLRLQSLPE
jgi:predicted nucleic acid-binding protein